jgi:iron complex outermembrane receptor protein
MNNLNPKLAIEQICLSQVVISFGWIALTLGGLTLAQSVLAQEAATDPAKSRQIEEVLVTATKRDKSMREIPISIDAFSGETLNDRGATSLEEILKYSSGVSVQNGQSGADDMTITIRGVSSNASTVNLGPATAGSFLDEIPLVNPSVAGQTPDIDPIDLAAVEVLKGPQGTLFGGSALAGAIRYVPNAPDLEEHSGGISTSVHKLGASNDTGYGYGGYYNLPLTETLAVRVAGVRRKNAGYLDDLRNGSDDEGGARTENARAAFLWEPTDWFALQGTRHLKTTLVNGTLGADQPREPVVTTKIFRESAENRFDIRYLKATFDLGPVSLVAISGRLNKTGYVVIDTGSSFGTNDSGTGSWLDIGYLVVQETSEIRVVSNGSSEGHWLLRDWEYAGGLFVLDDSDQKYQADIYESTAEDAGDRTAPSAIKAIDTSTEAIAEEFSIFFDATRTFNEYWELNLGLRRYSQTTDALISIVNLDGTVNLPPALNQLIPFPGVEPVRLVIHEQGLNPKLALTWRPRENVALIASAARGFRFGGVNGNPERSTGSTPASFESDEIWNYELGMRTDWLDKRLILDLTAFQIDWDNMQLPQPDNTGGFFVDNVGGSRIRGVEFGMQALLPWELSLTFNASYLDAKITEPFDSEAGPVPKGTRLPQSARESGSLVLMRPFQYGKINFNTMLAYSFSGDKTNSLQNQNPLQAQSSVAMMLSAAWLGLPGAPTIRLNATNLLDQRVPASITDSSGVDPDVRATSFVQPRQVTLDLSLSF